jgi:hypothetical protein
MGRGKLLPVSSKPSDLPGPPPAQPSGSPTQIAGQQVEPSTTVPHRPGGAIDSPAGTRTNTLAIVSLAAGIGSFFAHILPGVGGFTVALIAVITGFMARRQIKETGEQGMGMATAGMIIGIAHLLLIVLVVIALLFFIFVMGIALLGAGRR